MKKCAFLILFLCSLAYSEVLYLCKENVDIRTDSIHIVRDKWGVPHIYAPTDEEAIYGLMFAQCEDDFMSMQEVLYMANGYYGRYKGIDGAKVDYIVQLLRIHKTIPEKYETSFSPKFKRIIKAACIAVNRYAELHPEELVYKKAFPINEVNYLAGYLMGLSFMASIQEVLPKIFDDEFATINPERLPSGSNGIAIQKKRTNDGYNYYDVNSHQPLEGPFSWYECHVTSNEGMNMMGGALIGSITPNIGTNGNISWGHTLNYNDFFDVYKLTMHPTEKLMYKFDGKWLKLEEDDAKLKVKVKVLGVVNAKKKIYWSIHGPVVKSKSGYYAIRGFSYNTLGAAEQWYKMCKANSFTQFKKVLEMQQLPSMNICYGDKYDTIYYISNGLYSRDRHENLNWKNLMPGDTSYTLWSHDNVYGIDELPHLLNPSCGYYYSVNQSPFRTTHPNDQLNPNDYPSSLGMQRRKFNRSVRMSQMMDTVQTFNWELFKRIKFDKKMPDTVQFITSVEKFFLIDTIKNPDLADAMKVIRSSIRNGDINDTTTALFILAFNMLSKKVKYDIEFVVHSIDLPISDYEECLRNAKKILMKNFGKLYVPLGSVQRLKKGGKDLPLFGLPDVMAPMYTDIQKDGSLKSHGGECYTMLLKMADGKEIYIESIQVFGQSNRPNSKHYTDQMEMFLRHEMKVMTMDKTKIWKEAESIYHPK